MTANQAADYFEKQLARRTGLKVVHLPSPLKEPGVHIKMLERKVIVPRSPKAAQSSHELRLYVSVSGSCESETGRREAVAACETLAEYLKDELHLENDAGLPIAGTRITSSISEDDGILGDPDNEKLAWIDDLHYVAISYPAGE
ncbi:MAG TPA: hypothetical protein PLB91_01215 [Spirochaetales bacterium]|nr:hypothetical protein [Spirochaetales bacterium]HRY54302.1 hypothetical protein [Spirochaetia bacterium]